MRMLKLEVVQSLLIMFASQIKLWQIRVLSCLTPPPPSPLAVALFHHAENIVLSCRLMLKYQPLIRYMCESSFEYANIEIDTGAGTRCYVHIRPGEIPPYHIFLSLIHIGKVGKMFLFPAVVLDRPSKQV